VNQAAEWRTIEVGYHPIESLMRTTMDSLKDMVDVNTVVGDPVETKEGTVIIPVSRVSFGFVTGGGDEVMMGGEGSGSGGSGQGQASGTASDRDKDQDQDQEMEAAEWSRSPDMPFTGGTGAGVSVRPVGFLVVGERKVRFLPVDSRALFDRLIDEAPEILDRFAWAVGRRGEKHRDQEGPDRPDESRPRTPGFEE
jgi:uncharacterized spore protein YtfJ